MAIGPIEPPLPTNVILDGLRPLLPALRAAAAHTPGDARLVTAFAHLSAAIAALELPAVQPGAQTPPP